MKHIVIVGGGTAGSVLAARLSHLHRVTLLEMGAVDEESRAAHPVDLHDFKLELDRIQTYDAFLTEKSSLADSDLHKTQLLRGTGLGGSSAVNGGYFEPASAADFDYWASIAGPSWSLQNVQPLIEGMLVQPFIPYEDSAVVANFKRISARHGFTEMEGFTGTANHAAVQTVGTNIIGGKRISAATAYLPHAGKNLTVIGGARVTGVVPNEGVTFESATTGKNFLAADEIILSAGAIETARILLASGIGPGGSVKDLPVGVGTSDHATVVLDWPQQKGVLQDEQETPHALFPAALRTGKLELLLAPGQLRVSLMRQESRGEVTLQGIRQNYLSVAADLRELSTGVLLALKLGASAGTDLAISTGSSLDEIAGWIKNNLDTAQHTCGTARMGAVTDGSGRVLGVPGLRVADLSLLSRVPERGTAHTAMLIGEIIARELQSSK